MCAQAVLEERLVVVAGSKLEAFFRSDILPSFELAFAQVAAACQALSSEVRGICRQKVRRLSARRQRPPDSIPHFCPFCCCPSLRLPLLPATPSHEMIHARTPAV